MKLAIHGIIFLLTASLLCDAKALYKGDQVWRFNSSQKEELWRVHALLRHHDLDIWSSRIDSVEFRVPKNLVPTLTSLWSEHKIPYQVIVDDVEKQIEEETTAREQRVSATNSSFAFDVYHSLDEIFAYLDDLEASSNLVTSEEIGRTIEGREIRLMKVSSTVGTDKLAVWIDCGIHAREWISPAVCLWGLNYLTSQYGIDGVVTSLLDNNDFFIVPVLNADGYDYSWTTDRLWRKNRMQHQPQDCFGVDLNRNYDDGHWGQLGSSNHSCSEIYHGPAPFSELETTAVRDKILIIQATQPVKIFFSIHSYGQLWLFVFGYTITLPPEVDELYRVSQAGVDGIASVNGSVYINGPHFTTIYPASGISADWGYSVGIVHSYIVELRDKGDYGFLLPEDQILPTATEAWTGFAAAINAI